MSEFGMTEHLDISRIVGPMNHKNLAPHMECLKRVYIILPDRCPGLTGVQQHRHDQ